MPRQLFVLFFFFIPFVAGAQSTVSYGFESFNACNWDWLKQQRRTAMEFNTEEREALTLKYDRRPLAGSQKMEFTLQGDIIIPDMKYRNVTVSVNVKSQISFPLRFLARGFDRNEKIIFEDTISISGISDWKTFSISAKNPSIGLLKVYFIYKGDEKPNQWMALKDFTVKLDGVDISITRKKPNEKTATPYVLETNKIVPFESQAAVLSKIPLIGHQKMIALGESTHGSADISDMRFLFSRTLIEKYNARLLLLEIPFNEGLLYNAYVQGLIPGDADALMRDYLNAIYAKESILQFLKWVREYNTKAERKILVVGIDNTNGSPFPIMDFNLAVLGEEAARPYLIALQKRDFNLVYDKMAQDSLLKSRLGTHYTLYKWIVRESISPKGRYDRRDVEMARRALFLDSLLTQPDERTILLAHTGHLQKLPTMDSLKNSEILGSLLYNKRKKDYFVFDFKIGSGTFTQDSCMLQLYTTTEALTSIPENSFEAAALKTGYPYFCYPASALAHNMTTTSYITRNSQNRVHFIFSNLRKRADGYVFIKESHPFADAEKEPLKAAIKFQAKKSKQYNLLLHQEFRIK